MANTVVNYGLYVPNFGKASHPTTYANLALEAEKAGWDGFFLWDHLVEKEQRVLVTDSFIALAAIAQRTKRIRIGTTVTPLPKLKPWIAARQMVTLDQLSNGRIILGVGLGLEDTCAYARLNEDAENKILAEKLDESLDIITGLWSGRPFSFEGKHYKVGKTTFIPKPVQKPRIPIWVGGSWPKKRPFKRAAKWDGVLPLKEGGPIRPTPNDLRDILSYTRNHRTVKRSFDAVIIGWGTGKDRKKNADKIAPYINAGMTWWLESLYTCRDSTDRMLERIRLGPPKVRYSSLR
ncbi:MAG TPA: LLM class flavin-dependent oxidoreductase [Candidatus Acidoferrales bacterium]|nr:LLM class flavin-dependent oxidoreductase [Candidatus Acidoferrales bacterium]